jgi:hypothetical protein
LYSVLIVLLQSIKQFQLFYKAYVGHEKCRPKKVGRESKKVENHCCILCLNPLDYNYV